MAEHKVETFFYGSFINLDVLAQVNLVPDHVEVGRLSGFDIEIRPLANLVRSARDVVYGILAKATHAELERLYRFAETDLGGRYLPEAVLVETGGRTFRPALCYIAPQLSGAPATADYVERIAGPARELGFPDWYVQRIESFAPRRPLKESGTPGAAVDTSPDRPPNPRQ
jgi:hypothetical protein